MTTEPAGFEPLTPNEARVLAVLVEKRHTVPDAYPMSVNALQAGCNQKTSRDPTMELAEADVLEALEGLRARSLAIESSGGRVMRYEENAKRALGVPSESVALLATLMLRGPQTPAELRAHCERLHRFSDVSAVEAYLEELAARPQGAYVRRLARAPGAREARWVHLLCGEPAGAGAAHAALAARPAAGEGGAGAPASPGDALERLAERVARLEAEVAALRARLDG